LYHSHTRIAEFQCGYVPFFHFPSFRGLEAALRIENGGLLIGKNGNLGCMGRFSHSTENSEEPQRTDC
jgi:hypothetical protein